MPTLDESVSVNFCNPSLLDSRHLFQVLAQVISLDDHGFAEVYEDLKAAFQRTSKSPFHDDFVRKPLSLISRSLLPPPSAEHPGIDLPCWLERTRERTHSQTVMLLGQDPLRDDSYFTAPSNHQPYVVIGTPYSVHSQSLRRSGNNPRYWRLICTLLDAGSSLYLTDVVKLWVRGQGARLPLSADHLYRSILEREIDLVAPSLVVAFGTRAAQSLLGREFSAGRRISDAKAEIFCVGNTKVLPVLHPSPRNTPILPAYLRANDVDPTKGVDGITEVITNVLSRLKNSPSPRQ